MRQSHMSKESSEKTKEKLPKIKLRGFEKCQNEEEFRRLMNVERGDDPCHFEERKTDPISEARRRAVSEKIARDKGFID